MMQQLLKTGVLSTAIIFGVLSLAPATQANQEPTTPSEPEQPWCQNDDDCPPGALCLDGTCKIAIEIPVARAASESEQPWCENEDERLDHPRESTELAGECYAYCKGLDLVLCCPLIGCEVAGVCRDPI